MINFPVTWDPKIGRYVDREGYTVNQDSFNALGTTFHNILAMARAAVEDRDMLAALLQEYTELTERAKLALVQLGYEKAEPVASAAPDILAALDLMVESFDNQPCVAAAPDETAAESAIQDAHSAIAKARS